MFAYDIERSENARLSRVRDGETWYSIETDGTLVADKNNGQILKFCPGGLNIREINGMAQFSHPDLDMPIEPLFDNWYRYARLDCNNPVAIGLNEKWGFITQEGVALNTPLVFDAVFGFKNGFAAVSFNGLWGIINETSTFVVEPVFDGLRGHGEPFIATKDGREFWINAQGDEIPEPMPSTDERAQSLECNGGAQMFTENGLWGMRDPSGDVIIAPEFRALSCYNQGLAWGAALGADAWCPIGPDSQSREKPACRQSHYPYILTHHFPESFADDRFESSVLWVRAYLDYGLGLREAAPTWVSDGVMGDVSSSVIRQ